MVGIEDIRAARERIRGILRDTPAIESQSLSELCGVQLFLKCETLQRTGSFKARGALNRLLCLPDEDRRRGVIAASAGNHAQGVAFATATVGVRSLIVMPEPTPLVKVSRTRAWGAEVLLHGQTFDEAFDRAREIQEERGLIFIHPFEDEEIIAGQGTAGLEILEQVPDVEAIVAPIGGGGLTAGIALAVKALRPDVEIYGVQSEAAPSMKRSFDAGELTPCDIGPSISEGITVKRPGKRTFGIIREHLSGIELVTEAEIEDAIYLLLDTGKIITEGAGASAFAAVLNGRFPHLAGRRVVALLSGANIDLSTLGKIIERSLVKQHRLVRLRITVRDRPGALAALLAIVAKQEANVLRIHHNRSFTKAAFWEVVVEVTLETRDQQHIDGLIEALSGSGYEAIEELGVTFSHPLSTR